MKTLETAKASDTSLTQDLFYALRYWLGGRRGLIAVAVLAVVGGVVLNWGWLAAAGVAPLILAALPCVAMCALGLCTNKMGGNPARVDGRESASSPNNNPAKRGWRLARTGIVSSRQLLKGKNHV